MSPDRIEMMALCDRCASRTVHAENRLLKVATKSEGEREDEEVERLVRPSPKKKPPRDDLRRERVETDSDPDVKPIGAETDKDLSRNYKHVAKRRSTPKPPKGQHRPGEVWKTKSGWRGMTQAGDSQTFPEREQAQAYAKGQDPEAAKKDDLEPPNPVPTEEMEKELTNDLEPPEGVPTEEMEQELKKDPEGETPKKKTPERRDPTQETAFDGSPEWVEEHQAKTPGGSLILGTNHAIFEDGEELGAEHAYIDETVIPAAIKAAEEALKAGKQVVFLAEGVEEGFPGGEQERVAKALGDKFGRRVKQDSWDRLYVKWSDEVGGEVLDAESDAVKDLAAKSGHPVEDVLAAMTAFEAGQGTDLVISPEVKEKLQTWGIPTDPPRAMYMAAFPHDAENDEDRKLLSEMKDNPVAKIQKTFNRMRQDQMLQRIKEIEASGGVAIVTPGASHAYEMKPLLDAFDSSAKSTSKKEFERSKSPAGQLLKQLKEEKGEGGIPRRNPEAEHFQKLTPEAQDRAAEAYHKAVSSYDAQELDEDFISELVSTAGGLKRKGAPADEFGEALAAQDVLRKRVINPSKVVPLSSEPADQKKMEGIARTSYNLYTKLTPALRSEAFAKAAEQLSEMQSGTPQHDQLTQVVSGMFLASLAAKDDRRVREVGGQSIFPEPSGTLKALLLNQMETGRDVSDLMTADFYSPASRASLHTRVSVMDANDLAKIAAGEDRELENMLKDALRKLKEPWQQNLLRGLLADLAVDDMTTMHAVLTAQAEEHSGGSDGASGGDSGGDGKEDSGAKSEKKDSPEPAKTDSPEPEKKDSPGSDIEWSTAPASAKGKKKIPSKPEDIDQLRVELMTRVKSSERIRKLMDEVVTCLEQNSDPNDCFLLGSSVRVQIAEEFKKALEEEYEISDPTHPSIVQLRRVVETQDPKEYDAKYIREGEKKTAVSRSRDDFSFYTRGIYGEGRSAPGHWRTAESFLRRQDMATMTKKGARSVTQTLDRVASLFQTEWVTLGVPERIASDFAYRCDLLSDRIERVAGLDRVALDGDDPVKEPGFDPEGIGEEKNGPLRGDGDESYMKGEFSQQENRELRERVQDGDLGMTPNPEPQPASSGKQAAFERMGREAASGRLATACNKLQGAAMRVVAKDPKVAAPMFNLAQTVMGMQRDVLVGQASANKVARTLEALDLLLPHVDQVSDRLAQMVALTARVAEEKDEQVPAEEPEKDEKEAKKAGEIPPQFLENVKKKQDEAAEKKDEKKDDEKKDDEKEAKKASHGFNLFS
jgi:hypothetical protein